MTRFIIGHKPFFQKLETLWPLTLNYRGSTDLFKKHTQFTEK